tara:strand:+ start:1167 stop:1592 length:426 start_codon:yes stop_codon:yes gene_type:complete
MKFIKIRELKYLISIILITLVILKFFNSPYNFYSILNWNYEDRMEQEYGYCKNESWGFYNYINRNYDLKNSEIKILNNEGFVTLEHLFNLKKNNFNKTKYVIILNFKSENDENIFQSKYSFLKDYKLKYRFNNCYLLELNE